MLVNAARHRTAALAERTCHAKLCYDGLSNERALVLQLVEKLSKLFFHLERDNLSLGLSSRHNVGPMDDAVELAVLSLAEANLGDRFFAVLGSRHNRQRCTGLGNTCA